MVLVLVCEMDTCDSTAVVFTASGWHKLHSLAFDLRHVRPTNIRWLLITDLRLLDLFFLGVEHIALTVFLFRIGAEHAHHLVGYALYAAWASTIVATSLTMSCVRGVFV